MMKFTLLPIIKYIFEFIIEYYGRFEKYIPTLVLAVMRLLTVYWIAFSPEAFIARIAIFVAEFFKMKKSFGFSQACEYYVIKYLAWIPSIKQQISSETQKVTSKRKKNDFFSLFFRFCNKNSFVVLRWKIRCKTCSPLMTQLPTFNFHKTESEKQTSWKSYETYVRQRRKSLTNVKGLRSTVDFSFCEAVLHLSGTIRTIMSSWSFKWRCLARRWKRMGFILRNTLPFAKQNRKSVRIFHF